jgi:hypothetical protein
LKEAGRVGGAARRRAELPWGVAQVGRDETGAKRRAAGWGIGRWLAAGRLRIGC